MVKNTDILIAGGYGTVGLRVAAELAPDYPGHIIVAGRSADKAAQSAAALGHAVRSRRIDVDDRASVESALEGVGVVLSCVDQREPNVLDAAIARGLAYTDIAPHLMTRRPTEAMKIEAIRAGARIVLGAGMAPGISSLLARLGANRVGSAESVASNTLLSVGDSYGPASRGYLLEEIAKPYSIRVDGREVSTRPFAQSARVRFPAPLGERTAYLFPFSDQVFFPETLGVATAISRIALDPPWLGSLLALLARLGVTARLRRRAGSQERVQRLTGWLRRRNAGHDWYGLLVEIRGTSGMVRAGLVGRTQATATAVGAAAIVRALAEGEVERPGIWLAEEVVPPEPFFDRLAARGLVPSIEAQVETGPDKPRHVMGALAHSR